MATMENGICFTNLDQIVLPMCGEILKSRAKAKKISQKSISEILGWEQSKVSKLLNSHSMEYSNVVKLAQSIGADPRSVIEEAHQKFILSVKTISDLERRLIQGVTDDPPISRRQDPSDSR
jgi:transcriptional regulator with XRE-family HTH domain